MSVGSTANTAFVMGVLYGNQYPELDARQRLLLVLLADACSPGFAQVDLADFAAFTTAPDAAALHDDLNALARVSLIKVSENHGGEAAVAFSIATEAEIAAARANIDCNFPFKDWT